MTSEKSSRPFPTHSHPQTWSRDGFFISTSPSLIPLATLNAAFASDVVYWAKPLPEDALREMVETSLCFGLYSATGRLVPSTDQGDGIGDGQREQGAETLHEIATSVRPSGATAAAPPKATPEPSSEGANLIGFARLITDGVTFAYLTDVYVLSEWKGQGLGGWLIQCVQEVLSSMPHLRRTMAIIGHGKEGMLRFYKKLMNMDELKGLATAISANGRGNVF